MPIQRDQVLNCRQEAHDHLVDELLPFWLDRCIDRKQGGYLTHFDRHGHDSGLDEKSLIAQARCLYTMASAHRAGYGDGACLEAARYGINFLLDKLWDSENDGFFWMADRSGEVIVDRKILYGQSFAIYALSEYSRATGDSAGCSYAKKTFEAIQWHCHDAKRGGWLEMFDRQWRPAGPGAGGGDRKTLDVHMHLMEAFTALFSCTHDEEHAEALRETMDILAHRMLHPRYGTGIAQFTSDWKSASQIKFDIVWGWDRFPDEGGKPKPTDSTSFGHNLELAWLMKEAADVLDRDAIECSDVLRKLVDHAVDNGIDQEFGGVYVEGPHAGGVYDREKEFWQQAEALVSLLDGCLLFEPEKYWQAYLNVHRFVFDKVINHEVGEWWPLLTREGEPIWTHMSHSWKINYHTVRAMVQSIKRLDLLVERL